MTKEKDIQPALLTLMRRTPPDTAAITSWLMMFAKNMLGVITAGSLCFLLLSCGNSKAVTANEATDAANLQITKEFPQITHLDKLEIKTRDLGAKWRVGYGGGTGGFVVDVDKRTGRAVIVKAEQ